MIRSVYGLLGVAAALALAGSCKEDPTSSLRGGANRVELEFTYREVVIGDSVRVTAAVKDAQNNPIAAPITISIPSSCTAGIASVTPTTAAPLPVTAFFLKGLSYGTTCVVAQSEGRSDTMQVATFPARLQISGPDTVASGQTVTFSVTFFDAAGNPLTGIPAPKWSSSDTTVAAVDSITGLISARAPGQVRVTATGTGSPRGGITFGKTFVIVPGQFTGTVVPSSGGAGDMIKFVKAAAGPAFDADTKIAFGPTGAIVSWLDSAHIRPDSVKGAVPPVGVTGPLRFLLTNIGPGQVALQGTITVSRADFADPYDGVNDDPTTSPVITESGDYFIVMHGTCTDGVVTDPGDDCDDFFTITNSSGVTGDSLTVQVDWPTNADVDILWLNAAGTGFVGNFAGATAANPERSTVIVPASTTWRLWINLFAPATAAPAQLVRVRVTGKN